MENRKPRSGSNLSSACSEADVALGDQLADRQTVAAIAARDLDHQAQMAAQKLPGSLLVLIALPALGELPLFLCAQHGKAARLLEVPVEIIARPHDIQILSHRPLWCKMPRPVPGGHACVTRRRSGAVPIGKGSRRSHMGIEACFCNARPVVGQIA